MIDKKLVLNFRGCPSHWYDLGRLILDMNMWKQRSETKINQLATQLQSTLDKNLEDKLQMLRMWGITSRALLTLMSQFHNHAQYLKVTNSVGPLDNPTWQRLPQKKKPSEVWFPY